MSPLAHGEGYTRAGLPPAPCSQAADVQEVAADVREVAADVWEVAACLLPTLASLEWPHFPGAKGCVQEVALLGQECSQGSHPSRHGSDRR